MARTIEENIQVILKSLVERSRHKSTGEVSWERHTLARKTRLSNSEMSDALTFLKEEGLVKVVYFLGDNFVVTLTPKGKLEFERTQEKIAEQELDSSVEERKFSSKIIIIALMVVGIIVPIIFGIVQCQKKSKMVLSIQGDKNIQIIGNGNYVDNRIYYIKNEHKPELVYSFSEIEQSVDGKYIKKLNIEVSSNIPVYNPKIYLKFNKVIQKVDLNYSGVLFYEKICGESNSNEYSYTTREFVPGPKIQFVFSNDTEFNIIDFKIWVEKE